MSSAKLDAIWQAVARVADDGSIRGKLDYRAGDGTGLLTFQVGGEAYTVDLYRSEDADKPRPKVSVGDTATV